mgnify:CR=1 FL=1
MRKHPNAGQPRIPCLPKHGQQQQLQCQSPVQQQLTQPHTAALQKPG